MRIHLNSIYVDDQRAALAFYTDVLGFTKHHDIPVGDDFWLTVVSPDQPDGPELLLEPGATQPSSPTATPSWRTESRWLSSPSTTSHSSTSV